jgi:hypothetical protein
MESDPPRLLINKEAKPSYRDVARSPHFISLVYPEVLRRLLTRALVQEKWTEDALQDKTRREARP